MPTNPPLVYRGQRHAGEATVVVVGPGGQQRPLHHHVRPSPGGREWGYGGSGPPDLARSILTDRIGWPPPPAVYQRFKRQAVARLASAQPLSGGCAGDDSRHRPPTRRRAKLDSCASTQLGQVPPEGGRQAALAAPMSMSSGSMS